MFRRAFGEHGVNPLSIYMRNYKVRLGFFAVLGRRLWLGE